jgi:hypothetical protein
MRVVHKAETFNGGDRFRLWPVGDLHCGAPDFDEAALRRHVKQIKEDPFARWIGMGDYGDLIDPRRDKRADGLPIPERYRDAMFKEGGIPSETVAHVCELLEPIAGQCIGFLEGNHETKIRGLMDRSIASEIAAELNISRWLLGYGGFVRWTFKRTSSGAGGATTQVIIHAHHGYQAGRRPGAKLNEIQLEKSRYPSADILLRGHAHERVGHVFDALDVGQHHVREAVWAYVLSGTYKLGRVDTTINDPVHSSWEERKGFHPKGSSRLGSPVITVAPSIRNGRNPSEAPFDLEVTL